jgi:hypothetical protein
MPFDDEDTGFRLMTTYSRTVGAIQVLYAAGFGWIALDCLSSVVQHEGTFKGVYIPPINLFNLAQGTMTALLSLSAFIGACGLLGLRPWARRWEIAYLFFGSISALAVIAIETRRGHDLGYIVLAYMIFALPYLPFLFVSPPAHEVPRAGKVTRAKPVMIDLDGL